MAAARTAAAGPSGMAAAEPPAPPERVARQPWAALPLDNTGAKPRRRARSLAAPARLAQAPRGARAAARSAARRKPAAAPRPAARHYRDAESARRARPAAGSA